MPRNWNFSLCISEYSETGQENFYKKILRRKKIRIYLEKLYRTIVFSAHPMTMAANNTHANLSTTLTLFAVIPLLRESFFIVYIYSRHH